MHRYRRFQKIKFREFILKNWRRLNFANLSLHPLVDFYFIKSHPEFPWTYHTALNPNITMDIVEYYPEYNWDYAWLSQNPNITFEYILSNPKKNWSWNRISQTLKSIVESVSLYPDLKWNWNFISNNEYITEEFVISHRDREFDSIFLSSNPRISIDFIVNYPEFNWSPAFVCLNPNIKVEDLRRLKYIDWIMASGTIDADFIIKHPEFPWTCCSSNMTLRDRHIISNPEIYWDWEDVACNPAISPELIRSRAREFFFLCPSISIREIERDDLSDEDLYYISQNYFGNSIDRLNFAQKLIYFWWIPKCYDINRESGKKIAKHNLAKYIEIIS